MKIWITGGAGSGKSSLAQDLAAALAAGGPRYYVATMVPRDDEDRSRIHRHIGDRAGMSFETIECPCRLMERIVPDPEGTYLLDSATLRSLMIRRPRVRSQRICSGFAPL